MAIIYSYPIATPKSKDLLVGTSVFDENDPSSERTNPTVSFTVQSLINLIGPIIGTPNLQQVTGAGSTTTNSITIANSLSVNGSYIDSYGQSGSNGEVLTSQGTGTKTRWLASSGGVTSITPSDSTFITITQNATVGAITTTSALSATGLSATPATRETQYLRGDNTWAVVSTGTTYQAGAGLTLDTSTSPDTFKVDYLGTDNIILSAGTATTPVGADTIIINDATTGNVVKALISGLPFDTYDKWILRGDNYDATVAATSQDVDSEEVMTVAGGTIIDTVIGDTRKVTIDHADVTVTQTDNTGTPLTPTFGDNIDLVASASGTTQGHMNTVVTNRITIPSNPVFIGPADANTDGIIGIVPAPAKATFEGGYFLRQDATWVIPSFSPNFIPATAASGGDPAENGVKGLVSAPLAATSVDPTSYFVNSSNLFSIPTGTGVISETVGIGDATVVNTPLTAVIDSAARSLTLSSKKYKGGGLVGYVPEGGTTSTYLKGDGSWAAIPTGLIFKGTWAASTTAVVNGALAASVDLVIATADAEIVVGTVVEGVGITGTVRVDTVVSTTEFTLDTAITISDAITLTMSPPGGLSPNIIGLTPADGWLYIVSVAGKAEPNSANPWTTGTVPNSWNIGDWCVYNGTAWTLVPSSTAGVTTVDTTDGTYIDLTPTNPTGGNVTVTADLSAEDDDAGDTSTRFLTKTNKWEVPSYTTDENTTYGIASGDTTVISLTSTDPIGAAGAITLAATGAASISGSSETITINATDTNTTYDYLTVGVAPSFGTLVGGSGYTSANGVATTVAPAGGTGMTVNINATAGVVTQVDINNPGSGYSLSDVITVTGGGADATFTLTSASVNTDPSLRLINSIFAFDDVKITGTNATTVTRTSDNGITINSLNTQNPFQTITGTGTNNTDSGILLSDNGLTVKILGDGTYITAAQSGNTITLTGVNTTYTAGNGLNLSGTVFSADINNTQANDDTVALSATANRFYAVQLDNNATIADADLVVNIPWTDTEYTGGRGITLNTLEFDINVDATASAVPEDLSTTANQTYKVQLDDQSENLVVNVPWESGGSYNWILDADSSGTTRTVASGNTIDFIGGTGVSAAHSTTGTITDVTFTNTGVIELNMPNTGPGEGGILLSANTGTIDIGIDYIGGNNIISTAYAGSGTVPTAAHILWADTAAAAASRKVFYSPVSDLPFSDKTGTVTSISASNAGVLVSTSTTTPTVGVNYGAAGAGGTNLILVATDKTGVAPQGSDQILVSDTVNSVLERYEIDDLPFSNNSGTVTSVGGTGTVSGLTLTGTVDTASPSGNLTLGGTLTLTSAVIVTGLGYTPYNNTNPDNFTNNTGTVENIGTGSGLTGGAITETGTISVDYSVATDNIILGADDQETVDIPTNARIMYADSTNAVRYAFVADLPFSSSTGDISGVTAGVALSGGGTSGTVTLNVRYAGTSSVIFSATDATGTDIDSDDIILYTDSEGATVNYGSVSDLNFLSNTTTTITTAQANAIVANTAKVSDTGVPAILSNGTVPTLNSGITATEVRTLIGAGTSSTTGTVTSVGTAGTVSGLTLTGTVTSTGNLTLGGTLSLTSANVTDGLGFTPYNATNPAGYTTNTGTVTGTGTANRISKWSTGGAGVEDSIIQDDGTRIGIGTTPDAVYTALINDATSGYKHIGANGDVGFYTKNEGVATANILYQADALGGFGANTTVFTVNSSGTLEVKGDIIAFGTPSDRRLKENIKPIESALSKAMKLQGVTFDWKEKEGKIIDIKQDIGFIAQDVQKVLPELVKENVDGKLSMRHQGIAPILLEAIKELKQEIEELKLNKCNCNK